MLDEVAHTFIPALGRQQEADLCEFEAYLVYILSCMYVYMARAI